MDNGVLVTSELNELSILEKLREQNIPNTRPAPPGPQDQEIDLVELSRQSLQLSRAGENQPGQEVTPTQETEETAGENETQVNYNEDENNLFPVEEEPGNVVPGVLEAEETSQVPAEEGEPYIEQLNAFIETFETTPGTEVVEAAEIAAAATTTSGSVVRETEPTVENLAEENPAEILNPLETQVNEVSRINEILANANGVPANSPVTDVERAAEATQYQQQVLLQTVGTQLAQAVPPSSIFSLLV